MTTTKKDITIIHYAWKLLIDKLLFFFCHSSLILLLASYLLIILLQYQGKMIKIEFILSYSVFKHIWPYRRLDLIQN